MTTSTQPVVFIAPNGGTSIEASSEQQLLVVGPNDGMSIEASDQVFVVEVTSGGVTSVTAGDASIVVNNGDPSNPTVKAGTLDQIANLHPPAANWSNNSHKITGLANGTVSTDAASFGQIPVALPPNGSASGDLSGSYPGPTVAKVNGAAVPLSKTILGSNGSGQLVDASAATLANNTSGNAATATNLAGAAAFPAEVSPKVVTLTQSAGAVAVNGALGNVFRLVLTASGWTLSNPTGMTDGQPVRVRLIQDVTGGRTISYGTAWDFGAAGAPTLSPGANKVDYIVGEYSADANAGAGAVVVSPALGF